MAKPKRKVTGRRKRSTVENIWLVISILIALAMVLSTVAALFYA